MNNSLNFFQQATLILKKNFRKVKFVYLLNIWYSTTESPDYMALNKLFYLLTHPLTYWISKLTNCSIQLTRSQYRKPIQNQVKLVVLVDKLMTTGSSWVIDLAKKNRPIYVKVIDQVNQY